MRSRSFEGLGRARALAVVSLMALELAIIVPIMAPMIGAPPADPDPARVCSPPPPSATNTGYAVRYDGLSAVLVEPRDQAQLELVTALAHDIWTDTRGPAVHGELVIVVDQRGAQLLRDAGLRVEVQIPDIQAVADAERERLQQVDAHRPGDWFAEFKPFAAVDAYAGQLAERHRDMATIREIGKSVEGRSIRALWITNSKIDPATKTTIVLNGGQHAREWISVMTTTCIADRLLRLAATDERISRILDEHEFVIVPVANPDGYVHSWDQDRYWRKNRRGRYGVDLNRNWDWAWGKRGASSNPRSPIYAGPAAFSEPETRALRDLIIATAPAAHVDLHSYSQLILYPWAHKSGVAPDRDRFAAYADKMASAIYATHGESYQIQAGADLYVASGTMSDWAYGDQGVASFVFELRPPAKGGGFVLPPEQIVPTCEESLNAILELADLIERDAPN